MSLTSTFQINSDKESQGVAISYSPDEQGNTSTFYITRSAKSNIKYTKALQKLLEPYQADIRLKNRSAKFSKTVDEIFVKAFVQGCLVRWDNISFSDVEGDKTLTGYAPFNEENAIKLFTRLPELFVDLQEKANDIALFREDELEESAKN